MLRTRIITALILAPLVVAAVYLLPPHWLSLFFAMVLALGAWEWGGLVATPTVAGRVGFVVAYLAICAAFAFVPGPAGWLIGLAAVAWLVAIVFVLIFPRGQALVGAQATVWLFGLVMLCGAWAALVVIGQVSRHWVMWVVLVCWAADVGAYFAGRGLGRRKLAPHVSPNKTWEGAIGGLLLALLVCGGLLAYAGVPALAASVLLIVPLVALSVFGDLFESVLKRASGTKDSGGLLPGHGGILDRIDSQLAATPFFAIWLLF